MHLRIQDGGTIRAWYRVGSQILIIILSHSLRRSPLALLDIGRMDLIGFAMVLTIVMAQLSTHASSQLVNSAGTPSNSKISFRFGRSVLANDTIPISDEESKSLFKIKRQGEHRNIVLKCPTLRTLLLVNFPRARRVNSFVAERILVN